ncbi:hypothetical protein TSUD_389830 [Trifolium subterraneum]|uniref:Uncharacterized protein n=1 Tax=Trifolium subterraneum TaxID=3900 RepID=A0A2Z6P2P9_TRISU|nr:hypothetical protein TSUD_389830 [Trifolium subterraneum]
MLISVFTTIISAHRMFTDSCRRLRIMKGCSPRYILCAGAFAKGKKVMAGEETKGESRVSMPNEGEEEAYGGGEEEGGDVEMHRGRGLW